MMESSSLTEDDLPAVVMPGATLKQATPGGLAEKLGLSYRRSSTKPVDVTIVGAGPAGLAAAVYGASEGLDTVLLDAVGAGGQGRGSSRIENYFGFPFGLSGADLTGLAVLQALKFGAQLASPLPGGQARHRPGTATCSACTCRAGKSLTAKPLSSRPAPATGRCRWNAGPTSRAPVSILRGHRTGSPGVHGQPGHGGRRRELRGVRRRCTWPGEVARVLARCPRPGQSRPRCRPISSTGCGSIRE